MNKYIKKKDLIKQLESLHESLEAYKNLGMVYAREQEELAADGDVDIDNQPIVERSEQIVSEILQMQKEITEEKENIFKIEVKTEEFRRIKYKIEHYRIDAVYLMEKLLNIDPDINIDYIFEEGEL